MEQRLNGGQEQTAQRRDTPSGVHSKKQQNTLNHPPMIFANKNTKTKNHEKEDSIWSKPPFWTDVY